MGPSSLDTSLAAAISAAAAPPAEEVIQGDGMRNAQMLVWLGDFNYRIDGPYEAVKERAIRNELGPLLELVRSSRGCCTVGCLL